MTKIRPSQIDPKTGNADKFVRVNSAGDEVIFTSFGTTAGDAEFIRDTIGAALVAGTGVTLTVNDAGDTITYAIDTATELERMMDFLGGVTTAGKGLVAGTNITLTYDDANDKITIAASGGGSGHTIKDEGTPLTARAALNFVGSGVTVTDDGSANTIVTIPGGGSFDLNTVWKGLWTAGGTYAVGDLVYAAGDTWLATAAHTPGTLPTFVQQSATAEVNGGGTLTAHGSGAIGDTQLLTIARHASYGVTATPSGWTLVGFYSTTHSGLSLFKRAIDAGNISSNVSVSWADNGRMELRTYRNAPTMTVTNGTGRSSPAVVVSGLLVRIVASSVSNALGSPSSSTLTADASLVNKSGPCGATWFGFSVIGDDPTAAGATTPGRTASWTSGGGYTDYTQWIDVDLTVATVFSPTGWVKLAHYDGLPLTTKGDIVVRSATADSRLPVGTDGQAIIADSTVPLGVKWGSVASGGGSGSPATTQQSFSPSAGTTALTLSATPTTGTLRVYRNGLIQRLTTDYTLAGAVVTLTSASVAGDTYLAVWDGGGMAANPWVKRVDATLATGALTGWTAGAGTWTAEVDRFRQASTTAAVQRLMYNTRLNQAMIVAECDIRVDSNPNVNSRAGFVFGTPWAADGGEGFLVDLKAYSAGGALVTGTNFERDAVTAGPDINMTPTIALGTWVNFRVMISGNSASAYVNGVLVGMGSIAMVNHEIGRFALYTYAADASFKNLKIWTIAMPDDTVSIANPWKKDIDLPLTTLTGWTANTGSWGLTGAGSTIRQVTTTAGEQMLTLNQILDLTECVVECEIMVNTSISTANGRAGILLDEPFTGAHAAGGMMVVLLTGTSLTVVDKVYWEQQGVLAGPTSPVIAATVATGVWIKFRLHRVGTQVSAYVNGVLIGQAHIHLNVATRATGKLAFYTYTTDSSFRNLKVWTKNLDVLP